MIPVFLTHSPAQVGRQLADALSQDVRFRLLGATCQPATLERDLHALIPTTPSLAVIIGGCGDVSARVVLSELLRLGVSRVVVVLLPDAQEQSRDLERKLLNQGAMHVEWAQLNDQGLLDANHLRRLLRLVASLSYVRVIQTTSRTGTPALRLHATPQTSPTEPRALTPDPAPARAPLSDAPTPVAPLSAAAAPSSLPLPARARATTPAPIAAVGAVSPTPPTPLLAAPTPAAPLPRAPAPTPARPRPVVERPSTITYQQAGIFGRTATPTRQPNLTAPAPAAAPAPTPVAEPPRARDGSGLLSLDDRASARAKSSPTPSRDGGSGLISLSDRDRDRASSSASLTRDPRRDGSGLLSLASGGRARASDSGLISLDDRDRARASLSGFSRDGGSGLHALDDARSPEPSFTSDPLSTMSRAAAHHSFDLVGIGSSTGGLTALESVLSRLPHDFPIPLCIAQHIGKGFDQDFVKTLQRATPLDVRLLHRPTPLTRGNIYVCPSGVHVVVTPGPTLTLTEHPASHLYRPSVSVFFGSMADVLGARSVGVLLTGMGDDGAEGMLRIRQRGGRTLVQNRETCLVFGMPRAAIQLGAAEQVLSVNDIAPELVRLAKSFPLTRR